MDSYNMYNMIQLNSNSGHDDSTQPKEHLLGVCLSKHSSKCEYYYYSTLGKKTGWCSYENTMALKTMLSRPLPSIQDTTEKILNDPPPKGVTPHILLANHKPSIITIFHDPTKVESIDRHLIINSSQEKIWEGFIMDGTLFLRGNSLEHVESIVAVIELAEERLKCHTLVICLDKKSPHLSTLVRSFFYFGFELVLPTTYHHNSNEFILVGIEF